MTFDDLPEAAAALAEGGALSQHLPNFGPRQAQIEMADAVSLAMEEQGILVAEAGTGIGKTFAYLAPALLSGQKCLVSTGTKHLQDQLFKKDLPTLREALRMDFKAVILKGRSNYLCIYRLAKALKETRQGRFEDFVSLRQLDEWGSSSETGDRVGFEGLAEDDRLWTRVTSTTDNCLGQDCPDYKHCFVVKARRAAMEADMVVINHHLFCADLALKDTGFGELLPNVDALVFDEAHQLPEIATRFFGKAVSARQIIELCNDVTTEAKEEGDMPDLLELVSTLPPVVNRLRMSMGTLEQRAAWQPLLRQPEVSESLQALIEQMKMLQDALDQFAERSNAIQSCFKRCLAHTSLLENVRQPEEGRIHWFETSRNGFIIRSTPLDVSSTFQQHMEGFSAAWVFTSATLAVGEDFSHFTDRLGLENAYSRQWNSPFDYQNNALLYLPGQMPLPNSPQYTAEVVKRALPLINSNPGGTFFLFTSYRAMKEAKELLSGWVECDVLMQGEASRQSLIEKFRKAGDALLLATSSFWEGVDVRGTALSLVIIDKLPFASPGDPVMEARLKAMRADGGNPFMDIQLPQAVIALKQGVGRLIRDMSDRGVLVINDPRLTSKAYGKQFLESVPPMPVTQSEAQAMAFLRTLSVNESNDE